MFAFKKIKKQQTNKTNVFLNLSFYIFFVVKNELSFKLMFFTPNIYLIMQRTRKFK